MVTYARACGISPRVAGTFRRGGWGSHARRRCGTFSNGSAAAPSLGVPRGLFVVREPPMDDPTRPMGRPSRRMSDSGTGASRPSRGMSDGGTGTGRPSPGTNDGGMGTSRPSRGTSEGGMVTGRPTPGTSHSSQGTDRPQVGRNDPRNAPGARRRGWERRRTGTRRPRRSARDPRRFGGDPEQDSGDFHASGARSERGFAGRLKIRPPQGEGEKRPMKMPERKNLAAERPADSAHIAPNG